MAKQLKINIKNAQIAEAINLDSLKNKLSSKKTSEPADEQQSIKSEPSKHKVSSENLTSSTSPPAEEQPRIKARSKSVFEEAANQEMKSKSAKIASNDEEISSTETSLEEEAKQVKSKSTKKKTSEELRHEIFGEELAEQEELKRNDDHKSKQPFLISDTKSILSPLPTPHMIPQPVTPVEPPASLSTLIETKAISHPPHSGSITQPYVKLGPTGRHVKDLIPPKPEPKHEAPRSDFKPRPSPSNKFESKPKYEGNRPAQPSHRSQERVFTTPRDPSAREIPKANTTTLESDKYQNRAKVKGKEGESPIVQLETESEQAKKNLKSAKFKDFKEIKPVKRPEPQKNFNTRDRQGLRLSDEDNPSWRKRRPVKQRVVQEETTIRPTSLKVRMPISIKDLANEMKLKSSQLIQKLFLQGLIVTLNDLLDDETTIQLLGQEFGCELTIDTSEEERLRITDKTIDDEIEASETKDLIIRPPVVAFMGHVDHGKTSLIDSIRKSNRAAGEAGAITQHIGAFRCHTQVGDIAILDTPGHEAFSAMRARGAHVTDIIVLVVAGDEGIKPQTLEAVQHAKGANVTIVVAINKCDKPNFNAENVYRQLSEHELLPEAWGGQTITVNCSAVTGEGITQLLEMLAIQAEILELKANPKARARGTVLESEMHKGMGAVATVLVQNGTLRLGDALVFGDNWGRIKTMRDEFSKDLKEAGPSTPVEITGVSGLPEAGDEFIVVKSEREAREIAQDRHHGTRQINFQQKKKFSMENLLQQASSIQKKMLNVVLRADVQGSLEAIKTALEKVHSDKAELSIIYAGVGEISESDVQLAAASKAVIFGFHTAIESHADAIVKQLGIQVRLHDIIYHAIDDVKLLMVGLLDKIAQETERGKAEVKATFKSSQVGVIAGCQVIEGSIIRNNQVRVRRKNEVIWKGSMLSLKRVKEDVREVQKGFECGILLNGFNTLEIGDIIEAYEISYIMQQL